MLYATPAPWQSVCWMQGLYAAGHVIHDRCNSLVKHTWQATRPGAWLWTPLAALGFAALATWIFSRGLRRYARTGSARYLSHGHRR